jgi:hypothetical protein
MASGLDTPSGARAPLHRCCGPSQGAATAGRHLATAAAAAVQHNAHNLRPPKHEGRNRNGRRLLLLLFNTTRMLSGPPPSTGAAAVRPAAVALPSSHPNLNHEPDPTHELKHTITRKAATHERNPDTPILRVNGRQSQPCGAGRKFGSSGVSGEPSSTPTFTISPVPLHWLPLRTTTFCRTRRCRPGGCGAARARARSRERWSGLLGLTC